MQVTHVIVHDAEQTRAIVVEAMNIANESDVAPDLWECVFREACRLLGQRFTLAYEPQPVQVPPLAILGNGRGT